MRIDCQDDLYVRCTAGALSQIFTNLIINSILHGFEGISEGEMHIEIRTETDANQNGQTCVVYSDNGHGMNEEQLEKLFDPFFTTKLNQGGSGLGTHIVRNLVTQTLDGEITASSEPGQGLHIFFSQSLS